MGEKTCTKCHATKALEAYNRNAQCKDGLHPYCRDCQRDYKREWDIANREKQRQYKREHYQANREQELERHRKYRQENRDRRNEYNRRWVADNPEYHPQYRQEYSSTIRQEVFEHFGTRCVKCGSADRLELDHVNNDGMEHRKELGLPGGGHRFYRYLVLNDFRTDRYELQVLCHECHKAKTILERSAAKPG